MSPACVCVLVTHDVGRNLFSRGWVNRWIHRQVCMFCKLKPGRCSAGVVQPRRLIHIRVSLRCWTKLFSRGWVKRWSHCQVCMFCKLKPGRCRTGVVQPRRLIHIMVSLHVFVSGVGYKQTCWATRAYRAALALSKVLEGGSTTEGLHKNLLAQ